MAGVTPPRPLAETDDRNSFDCGRDSMNLWFRRHGWANHAAGLFRANVICDAETGQIVGYVTLRAGQIVITGSIVPPLWVEASEEIVFKLDPVGSVSIRFAANGR